MNEHNSDKENSKRLIPRLRFPEFQDSGEWEMKKLGDVFESFSGGTPSTTNKEYYNGKIPFIRSAEIGKEKTELFISDLGLKKSSAKLVNKGDLLVALYGANSGDVSLSKISGAINQAILCMRSEYSNEFAYHYLTLKKSWIVAKYIQGGQGNLSGDIVKSIELPFPGREEQQKIADCLSSLDEVISGERQKLEQLKAHKKGLLQNLFPQEGETVPKLRFPEFKDSGEWEEKKLGEIYEFKITNSFSRDMLNYEFGEIKNIHYVDIHTKFNTLFDIKKEIVPFINPDVCIDKIKEDSYCKEGDIIFADASEDLNDVGKSIEIVNLNGEKLVSGLHTLLARQKENFFIVGFAGFLFKSDWIRKQIQREAQGAKVLGISANRISNINIKFPKSIEEQQKIATCLSSLDDLIQAHAQKIEALELHKKVLLQALFPDIKDIDNE